MNTPDPDNGLVNGVYNGHETYKYCQRKCRDEPNCHYFFYNVGTTECSLRETRGSLATGTNHGSVFGPKEC